MSEDEMITWEDLEARWRAPGPTPKARRKWVQRIAHRTGLKPFTGSRGASVRFRPADVLRAEERGARG